MDVLFENEHIIICSQFFDKNRVVLSFCPLIGEGQVMTKESGFGYKLFNKSQISAIYFIPKWNSFYQPHYLQSGLDIVSDLIKEFKEVVMYGVSMGAYAAVRYSAYFNADRAIAFCPVLFLTRERGNFDRRYVVHLDKVENLSDTWIDTRHQKPELIILYDKQHYPDYEHIDKFAIHNASNLKKFHIGLSAHSSFGLLNESGILSEVSKKLILSPFKDVESELKQLIRTNRAKSFVPWMIAAVHSSVRGRQVSAAYFYDKALSTVKHRKQNALMVDGTNLNLLAISACAFYLQHRLFDKFIYFYETMLALGFTNTLLNRYSDQYDAIKNRPKVEWVITASASRWQEHTRNHLIKTKLQPNSFIGIPGAPIWSKQQFELTRQKTGTSPIAVLVPDFRFGNGICLQQVTDESTFVDGFVAIDQRALTNECDQQMLDRAIKALHLWNAEFGSRAQYVLWSLFCNQITDRLSGQHIHNQRYSHPTFDYELIISRLNGLNIVDLSILLQRPIYELTRLFIDSFGNPSHVGYLLLDKILCQGLNPLRAYNDAILEVETKFIELAHQISQAHGGKVLITGQSVWLDTIVRYVGTAGIQKLAQAGLVIAPLNISTVYGKPLEAIVSSQKDLKDYQAVFVVDAGADLSSTLSSKTNIDQNVWMTIPSISWEKIAAVTTAVRHGQMTAEEAQQKTIAQQTNAFITIMPRDLELGISNIPSFSGLTAMLDFFALYGHKPLSAQQA